MSMSKKHFIDLAQTLYALMPDEDDAVRMRDWERFVGAISDLCARHNPAFCPARFNRLVYGGAQ